MSPLARDAGGPAAAVQLRLRFRKCAHAVTGATSLLALIHGRAMAYLKLARPSWVWWGLAGVGPLPGLGEEWSWGILHEWIAWFARRVAVPADAQFSCVGLCGVGVEGPHFAVLAHVHFAVV